MTFSDFHSVEHYLDSLVNYEHTFPLGGPRDRPKLEPTLRAVERLSLPLALPGALHVAGTKGKGSTVAFLEALFAPDAPTLSFTSPHLISIKERVRHNAAHLPDAIWCKGFGEMVTALAESPAIKLTYFESVFVFFLWAAREMRTGIHVVEAGLGGRWDATNVLKETVAVLTTVDYDHTEVLGDTLEKIARDKGGIIKPGATVVIGPQTAEVTDVYTDITKDVGARTFAFGRDYDWQDEAGDRFLYREPGFRVENLSLSVSGRHQKDNVSVAICAARRMNSRLTAEAVRQRVSSRVIPGRQQLLPGRPDVIVDVAHNPASFRVLADTLRTHYSDREILAVVAMMRDKDARTSLAMLQSIVHRVMVVELNSPRTAKASDLAAIARDLDFDVIEVPSMTVAFERLHQGDPHDLGLVAGSFYLAGDYLIWRQRAGIA